MDNGDSGATDQQDSTELRGRYSLGAEIARGAMGAIHRGFDRQLERELAIKVLLTEHHQDDEANARFIGEARITGQLQHPSIVPVHEVGTLHDQRPFFSMKLVDGKTLATLLSERTGTDDEQSHFLRIFAQICQAMAYAHNHGVIHRDLKPANIMVGAFGEVQVMDWGIAKVLNGNAGLQPSAEQPEASGVSLALLDQLTDLCSSGNSSLTIHGTLLGTPAYIAPEQARGDIRSLDERADVFSLGAILCEILTGHPPYTGQGNQVIRKAWNADLKDALQRLEGCSAEQTIIELARQCLSADPLDRPANAGTVADRVEQFESQMQRRLREAELARVDAVARSDAAVRRRWLYRMIVILLALHGVGVTVTTVLYESHRREQEDLHEQLLAQQKQTEREKKNAEESASRRAELLYAADMQLAPILWEREDTPTANLRQLLNEHLPEPGGAPEAESDPRGFEWYYFQSQLAGSDIKWEIPVREIALREDGDLVLVSDEGEIQILDPVTGACRSVVSVSADIGDAEVCLSRHGELLACLRSSSISLFDCSTGKERWQLETDFEPLDARFSDSNELIVLGPRKQFGARNVGTLVSIDPNDAVVVPLSNPAEFLWAESPLVSGEQDLLAGIVNPLAPNHSRIGLAVGSMTEGAQPGLAMRSMIIPFKGASLGAWTMNFDLNLFVAGRSISGDVAVFRLQDPEKPVASLEHAASMSSCTFSHDNQYLATGTSSGLIKLWSIRRTNGDIDLVFNRVLKGHLSRVSFLAFTPDGRRLISSDGDVTRSWELQPDSDRTAPFVHATNTCHDLDFSPDGKWYALADASQEKIELRNAETGETRWSRPLNGPPVVSVAFSADGRYVGFGHRESHVTVADVASGELIREWDGNNKRLSVVSIVFSADGKSLAFGFGFPVAHNTAIRVPPKIIDVITGATLMELKEHENTCSNIQYSTDGKNILTSSHFGFLTSWNLQTGVAERLYEEPAGSSLPWGNALSDFSIAPDGESLAIASEGGNVYLLDLPSKNRRLFSGHSAAVLSVAFSRDGKTLASASSDGTVRLWHVKTGREMVIFTTGLHHLFVRFSPDGKRLVAGGIDELDSGAPVRTWTIRE
ncbi:MAG: protein kinase [Planctomycetaceae bacterium]|nr:protein kinase [Planctomycetaceae bacterium]